MPNTRNPKNRDLGFWPRTGRLSSVRPSLANYVLESQRRQGVAAPRLRSVRLHDRGRRLALAGSTFPPSQQHAKPTLYNNPRQRPCGSGSGRNELAPDSKLLPEGRNSKISRSSFHFHSGRSIRSRNRRDVRFSEPTVANSEPGLYPLQPLWEYGLDTCVRVPGQARQARNAELKTASPQLEIHLEIKTHEYGRENLCTVSAFLVQEQGGKKLQYDRSTAGENPAPWRTLRDIKSNLFTAVKHFLPIENMTPGKRFADADTPPFASYWISIG